MSWATSSARFLRASWTTVSATWNSISPLTSRHSPTPHSTPCSPPQGCASRWFPTGKTSKELSATCLYPEAPELDPSACGQVSESHGAIFGGGGKPSRFVGNHIFVNDRTVCLAFITPRSSATDTGQGSAMFTILNRLIGQFLRPAPASKSASNGTPPTVFYNATTIKRDLKGHKSSDRSSTGSAPAVALLPQQQRHAAAAHPVAFGTLAGARHDVLHQGRILSLAPRGIGP